MNKLLNKYKELSNEQSKIVWTKGVVPAGLKAQITRTYNQIKKQGLDQGMTEKEISLMMLAAIK